jgi:hypothetical protein
MARLLDLPLEIRAMIFKPLLVSPTGYLVPVSRSEAYFRKWPGSLSPSGPIFYLATRSLEEAYNTLSPQKIENELDFVSPSLLRVCQAIYQETSGLFWKSNTFVFYSPSSLQTIFKRMGKFATRRIVSTCLSMPLLDHPEFTLQTLSMRVANGTLQRLDIVFQLIELHAAHLFLFNDAHSEGIVPHGELYTTFLLKLKNISKLEIPKRLIILRDRSMDESRTAEFERVIHDMEEEWGDKIYQGEP